MTREELFIWAVENEVERLFLEDALERYSYNTIASIPSMGANRPIMLEL